MVYVLALGVEHAFIALDFRDMFRDVRPRRRMLLWVFDGAGAMLFLRTFTGMDLGLSVVEFLSVVGLFLVKSVIEFCVFFVFFLLILKVPFVRKQVSRVVRDLMPP